MTASRRAAALATITSLLAAAPAGATCWRQEDVAAAKVRDMGTLIATVAARCETAGHSVAAAAGEYADASRGANAVANQRLKARFWTMAGQADGSRLYEEYVAGLAAPYGKVPAAKENCAQVVTLAQEAVEAGGSLGALAAVADRNNFTPALPGGICPAGPVQLAARALSMAQ